MEMKIVAGTGGGMNRSAIAHFTLASIPGIQTASKQQNAALSHKGQVVKAARGASFEI
jgi:hypothetical protein